METQESVVANQKRMKLRYAGTCRLCGTEIAAKVEAIYEKDTRTVRCLVCTPAEAGAVAEVRPDADAVPGAAPTSPEPEMNAAGASARREYERRKAKDEAALREKWGRFGGIAVALADEKQSTKAWDRGAVGEERMGKTFDLLVSDDVRVLHDRRIPGSRANIDHILVTTAGVWVVDAKRYKGRPELKIEGGILRPRTEKLTVGGRDCTKLVDGVLKQAELVREVVGDVPVTPVLCFVESDWPLVGGSFRTRGVHVLWPRKFRKMIQNGEAGPHDAAEMAARLAAHFPVA